MESLSQDAYVSFEFVCTASWSTAAHKLSTKHMETITTEKYLKWSLLSMEIYACNGFSLAAIAQTKLKCIKYARIYKCNIKFVWFNL